jgi:cytoskeleton protein RodZ
LLAAPRIAPPVAQDQPLMASMAPFPGLETATPTAPVTPAVESNGSGDHSVSLNLSAASWVEVIGQDGSRMEYGLLPAGSSKTYRSDQPLDVRIGNASGAQLSIDGQVVALENFRRANVARLRVEIADGKAAAASL